MRPACAMDIILTHHAAQRMAQRLPKQSDLDLILKYGVQGDNGLVMTNESVEQADQELIQARRNAEKVRRLKGVAVPLGDNGCAITLQRLNRRKAKRVFSRRRYQD